jgi:hypothetical protein
VATFFFDVTVDGTTYPDVIGVDLYSLADARDHALRLAARLKANVTADFDEGRSAVHIRRNGPVLATICVGRMEPSYQ